MLSSRTEVIPVFSKCGENSFKALEKTFDNRTEHGASVD